MFTEIKSPLLNKKNKPLWLIAPIITLGIIITFYIVKGIFPFGENSIVSHDLYCGTGPTMYYSWDIWHGKINPIYDFISGGGFGRNALLTIFLPQNLFAAFFPRDMIYDSISILMIIKFVLVSLSSAYVFNKIFTKLNACWVITISLMYTFSGFDIIYASNIDWLDVVALFPLLVLFMLRMFNGKSILPYSVVLGYLLIVHTYMSWFVVLTLVVFGGLYLFIVRPKEERKSCAYKLGIGTLASVASGSYQIYSLVSGLSGGARYSRGMFYSSGRYGTDISLESWSDIFKVDNEIDITKIFMFLGTAISISFLILMWVALKKHKEIKKPLIFFTVSIIFFIIEALFSASVLLWHGGSYQFFPYRNGFTVMFMCCLIVGYYNIKLESFAEIKKERKYLSLTPFLALFFLGIGLISYAQVFYYTFNSYNVLVIFSRLQSGYFFYPYTVFALLLFSTFITLRFVNIKLIKNTLSIIIVLVILISNYFTITEVSDKNNNTAVKKFSSVNNTLENNEYDRFYIYNNYGIYNYAYITSNSSIGTWTPSLAESTITAYKNLGYTAYTSAILDNGATEFTKSLLRVTDIISSEKIKNSTYTYIKKDEEGLYYYKNNTVLPFGTQFNSEILSVKYNDNIFKYQNDIYKSLIKENCNLFERIPNNTLKQTYKTTKLYYNKINEREIASIKDKVYTVTGSIIIQNQKTLYININEADCSPTITITAKSLETGKKTQSEKFNYSSELCESILNLGTFKNEEVSIEIKYSTNVGDKNTPNLYLMDNEKLEKLCSSQEQNEYTVNEATIKTTVNAEKGKIIFLPVTYDENWSLTVNGKEKEFVCVLDNFIGIKAEDGVNEIELTYSNKDFVMSILVFISGTVIGLLILLLNKKIKPKPFFEKAAYITYITISFAAILILYGLPVIGTIIKTITN